MPSTLAQLAKHVQALTTDDVAYSVNGATVTASVADEPFVVAELDEKAHTFRFLALKSSQPTPRTPTWDAGGIYNAAKRGGLTDHRPSQVRVKAALGELFTRNGWSKVR